MQRASLNSTNSRKFNSTNDYLTYTLLHDRPLAPAYLLYLPIATSDRSELQDATSSYLDRYLTDRSLLFTSSLLLSSSLLFTSSFLFTSSSHEQSMDGHNLLVGCHSSPHTKGFASSSLCCVLY